MACVAANTIIAATEHYNQPQWLGDTQCKSPIFRQSFGKCSNFKAKILGFFL